MAEAPAEPVSAPEPVAEAAPVADVPEVAPEPIPAPVEPMEAQPIEPTADPMVAQATPDMPAAMPIEPTLDEPAMNGSIVEPAKKKLDMKYILMIALAALLVIGLVVAVIFILSGQKSTPTNTKSDTSTTEKPKDEIGLICTYEPDASTLAQYQGLKSYTLKMIANYYNDELVDISTTDVYTYTTADAAKTAAQRARSDYMSRVAALGLTSDPFDSMYPVSGTIASVTHMAEYAKLTVGNASIFGIAASGTKIVDDIASIEATYKKGGYECTRTDAAVETETPEGEDTTTDAPAAETPSTKPAEQQPAEQTTPTEQTTPAEQATPAEQTTPVEQSTQPAEQTTPATTPAEQTTPAASEPAETPVELPE